MLRADLDIDVIDDHDAAWPAIVIRDPMRGTYYRLQWPEAGILLAWRACGDAGEAAAQGMRTMFGVAVSTGAVDAVVAFARSNQLVASTGAPTAQELHALALRRQRSLPAQVLHNYLFFRIPLFRPDALLRRCIARTRWLFSGWFWCLVAGAGLLGIYLASRQMESVTAAVSATLALQALPTYAFAILALKAVHECGHALTAAHLGCRVPTMGVAVMLSAPVLYTDVSDSWRLPRRADRLKVVFAGVAAEAVVAAFALLAWAIMADGGLRPMLFALATSAVLLSLFVNLNPMMRFDGYFALSDWWRVPNLQERAFDFGLWRLREALFGLGRAPPETVAGRLRTWLIVYAWCTAVYRFFLFLGIAVIVLYVAGKAIGLFLAAVEIGVFIVLPILRELKVWWSMRRDILARSRVRTTAIVAVSIVCLAVTPWISSAEAPAVAHAADEEALYLAYPARITRVLVRDGQQVRAGDILFQAEAPNLHREKLRADAEVDILQRQVDRWHVNERERDVRLVLDTRLAAARERVAGLERRIAQLTVRAPLDGRATDVDTVAAPGRWYGTNQALARIVAPARVGVRAVIAEEDLGRIRIGAAARFVADDASQRSIPLVLADLQPASDGRLSEPALAERHGGAIATGGAKGDVLARRSGFEVTLAGQAPAPPSLVRGVVRIDADPVSPLTLVWRAVARIVVREHGF